MFTGIIEGIGIIKSALSAAGAAVLTVEASFDLSGVPIGGSIAVDGACLTVTEIKRNAFSVDVSHKTLASTTLGEARSGSRVNIERPLTLSKPLGGHIVTGHVDCVGKVKSRAQKGGYLELEVVLPPALARHIVKKGSVAVDGISLTVTEASEDAFKLLLIPHTMKNTTLPEKAVGASVNIETDLMAKYAEKFFRQTTGAGSNVTEGFLLEHGFVKKGHGA